MNFVSRMLVWGTAAVLLVALVAVIAALALPALAVAGAVFVILG